jgi:isopentenyl-diphosphate delta-isomerase
MTVYIPAWGQDGTLTPVEKLEVHQLGLRHKAVSVFVTSGDRILIQQRALDKYHTPGLWANTCCTHPMWQEADDTCALRRLRDELNLEVPSVTYAGEIEYRAEVGNGLIEHEVVAVFHANLSTPVNIAPNPHEVHATQWLSIDEILRQMDAAPEKFTPWFRIYMTQHLEMILA